MREVAARIPRGRAAAGRKQPGHGPESLAGLFEPQPEIVLGPAVEPFVEPAKSGDHRGPEKNSRPAKPTVTLAAATGPFRHVELGEWPARHVSEHNVAHDASSPRMPPGRLGHDAERLLEIRVAWSEDRQKLTTGPLQALVDRRGGPHSWDRHPGEAVRRDLGRESGGGGISVANDEDFAVRRRSLRGRSQRRGHQVGIAVGANDDRKHQWLTRRHRRWSAASHGQRR